jgi:thiamine-monophosphate kinase
MSQGEFDIIARYFTRPPRRREILLSVGDDAAVVATPAGKRLVVAMDTIVEGIHFLAGTAPEDIGYRVVAVNLSDMAAMGAEPAWMTLSLSAPAADESWIAGFARGMFEAADPYQVDLIGGDTVKGPLVATVQIAGWVEQDRWLTRSGAQMGDLIFVSGVPGEAAAGLATIQQKLPSTPAALHLQRRFLRPEPRVQRGRKLRSTANSAMDVSDGLLTDLDKLCAASGCSARVEIDALPLSMQALELFSRDACVDYALAGGDDYEMIFTLPPARLVEFQGMLGEGAVRCTQIGVITPPVPGNAVECWRAGQPFIPGRRGYDHFAPRDPSP